jgi:hypothetical protein
MTTDDIAILRLRYRSDDRPAIARRCCAPGYREAQLCSRFGMRGEPNMFGVIGTVHRKLDPKAIRPAVRTGRIFTN